MAKRKKGKGKRQPMTKRKRGSGNASKPAGRGTTDSAKKPVAGEAAASEPATDQASSEASVKRTSAKAKKSPAAETPAKAKSSAEDDAVEEAAGDDVGDSDAADALDDAADASDDAAVAAADIDDEASSDDGDDADDDDDDADDDGDDDDDADDDEEEDIPERGASWGWPLARFERKWTWLETRLLFGAPILLTVLLCLWFAIRGMKEPLEAKVAAGTVFRAAVGMFALGGLARFITRGREEKQRNIITVVAVIIGAVMAPSWRGVGIAFFSNLLDWLQEGSTLTLMGGLKGVSTRLTMTVALLGASLAAASGTHINIDVVVRFVPKRFRLPVNVAGSVAAAAVCVAVAIGFFDFIAVTGFGAPVDVCEPMVEGQKQKCRPTTFGEEVSAVTHHMGENWFLLRKQAKLDIGALPYIIKGRPWNADERFSGADWNRFLDENGFAERYGAEPVAQLKASGEDMALPRMPFVTTPTGQVRGIMVHTMDLIFPLGFLMIGLRFILRSLLVLSGFIRLDEHEGGGDSEEDDEEEADDEQEAGDAAEGVA